MSANESLSCVLSVFFFIIQIVLKLRYVVQSKKRTVPARFYVPFISIRSRKSKLKIFSQFRSGLQWLVIFLKYICVKSVRQFSKHSLKGQNFI